MLISRESGSERCCQTPAVPTPPTHTHLTPPPAFEKALGSTLWNTSLLLAALPAIYSTPPTSNSRVCHAAALLKPLQWFPHTQTGAVLLLSAFESPLMSAPLPWLLPLLICPYQHTYTLVAHSSSHTSLCLRSCCFLHREHRNTEPLDTLLTRCFLRDDTLDLPHQDHLLLPDSPWVHGFFQRQGTCRSHHRPLSIVHLAILAAGAILKHI